MKVYPKTITRLAIASFLLAIAWAAIVSFLTRSVPISIEVGSGNISGAVELIETVDNETVDNSEIEGGLRNIATGMIKFSVPRYASSFLFRFHSDSGVVRFPLVSIRFFGIPLLTSQNIPHFQMEEPLYASVPDGTEPLLICCKNESILNLPNVFPVAMRLIRAATLAISAMPVVLVLFFWLCFFFGRYIIRTLDQFLSKPIFFAILLVVCVLFLLPDPVQPIRPGLDQSWQWLLNHFAFSGSIGQDFVFTYGPLGFLISPQITFANVIIGIVSNAFFLAISALLIFIAFRHTRTIAERGCVYMSFVVWIIPWSNGMEWRWCAIGVSAAIVASISHRIKEYERLLLLAVAAFLAAFQSYIKFSNCIVVVVQQMAFLIIYVLINRRQALKGCLVYIGSLFLSQLILIVLLFPSYDALVKWISGSLEIAAGYNLYMCTEKPFIDYIAPFTVLLLLPLVWGLFRKDRMHRAMLWLAMSPLIFCTYKYSVVRQGAEPLLLLMAFLPSLLAATDARFRKNALVISTMSIVLLFGVRIVLCDQFKLFGFSATNVLRTFNPSIAFNNAKAQGDENAKSTRLPMPLISSIGTNGVLNIGSDYGTAMSGDYNVIPFPATQNYSAYTAYLDRISLDRLSDQKHPVRFVLAPEDPQQFDSRNACLDNLRIWNYVRRHYETVGIAQGQVLLRRRTIPRPVKTHGNSMTLRYTLMERLRGLIFRVPRVMAKISYENGVKCIYAVNPETVDGVSCPEFLPRTPDEVRKFFAESPDDLPRVVSIEFERY